MGQAIGTDGPLGRNLKPDDRPNDIGRTPQNLRHIRKPPNSPRLFSRRGFIFQSIFCERLNMNDNQIDCLKRFEIARARWWLMCVVLFAGCGGGNPHPVKVDVAGKPLESTMERMEGGENSGRFAEGITLGCRPGHGMDFRSQTSRL